MKKLTPKNGKHKGYFPMTLNNGLPIMDMQNHLVIPIGKLTQASRSQLVKSQAQVSNQF